EVDALRGIGGPIARGIELLIAWTRRARSLQSGVALVGIVHAGAEAGGMTVIGAEREDAGPRFLQAEVAGVVVFLAQRRRQAERQRFARHEVDLSRQAMTRPVREIVITERRVLANLQQQIFAKVLAVAVADFVADAIREPLRSHRVGAREEDL